MPWFLDVNQPREFLRNFQTDSCYIRGAHGIRCFIHHIEDMLVMISRWLSLNLNFGTICNVFTNFRFWKNTAKSLLEPKETIKYLGIMISSWTLILSQPDDKIMAIQQKCKQAPIK